MSILENILSISGEYLNSCGEIISEIGVFGILEEYHDHIEGIL